MLIKTPSQAIHKREFTPVATGPLSGIRVLDLSRLVSGNTATFLLADLGAEVIKIEPAAGDTLRHWLRSGYSTHWKNLSRSKKSFGLDLRRPGAVEVLKRLVPQADMLVENFRPGTLEKIGLSPEVLLALNPRLVIVRISGWGQTGPYRNRPGFGTLAEGMTGFAAANGFPDREPVLPPGPLADTMAGYCAAVSALAALRHAQMPGGEGQVIDQSLFTPLFISQGPQAANYQLSGQVRPRDSNSAQYTVPRGLFRTGDGNYVTLSASMEPMPQRVFEAIGKGHLNQDPNYNTAAARTERKDEILGWVADFMATMTQAEAVAFFEARDVTVAPIYDISHIMDDPHFQETEVVVTLPDPEMGEIAMFGFANQLSRTPANYYRPAPSIGQDNDEVLSLIGMDKVERAALEESGAVHRGKV
ncbi:CaiB/BaiF CoA transferase family protein [Falsirhodobacter sp. 20TX0035]|uniref:CaiB/BaiF CoA transferase family protein n=1 Tax=Falsirhodobacter sp. 20TX0035 TaxID=3022019 RepID=UPI002330F01E|nr:CoA transferase [Falsirhodobacter sp. 20TX0035]MDB6454932.1 CoA transferase [Falsirhodobacter sp. 20TX0035]